MSDEEASVSEYLLVTLVVAFFGIVFCVLIISSGCVIRLYENFKSMFGG
jgi:hypothetical protein